MNGTPHFLICTPRLFSLSPYITSPQQNQSNSGKSTAALDIIRHFHGLYATTELTQVIFLANDAISSEYRKALQNTCTESGITDIRIITKNGCLNETYQASFRNHLEQRQQGKDSSAGTPMETNDNDDDDDDGDDKYENNKTENIDIEKVNGDRCVQLMTRLLNKQHSQRKYKKGIDLMKGLTRVRRNKHKLTDRSKLGSFQNMKKFLRLEDPKMKDFKYLALSKTNNDAFSGGRMTTRASSKKVPNSEEGSPKEIEEDHGLLAETSPKTTPPPPPSPSPQSPRSPTPIKDSLDQEETPFEIKRGALIIFGKAATV